MSDSGAGPRTGPGVSADARPGAGDTAGFTALFERYAPRVFAYALRHVGRSAAEDVVADTFLVAWRRRLEMPAEPLPWLLVVARKTIGNRRRGQLRHDRLVHAVGASTDAARSAPGADETVAERELTVRALGDLTALEREALLLVAWDGLAPAQAAAVAGCSPRAFEVRLSRARARLARSLAAAETGPDTDHYDFSGSPKAGGAERS